MTRRRNTDRSGKSFTAQTIAAVWTKGQIVPGVDPTVSRKDSCGAWINYSEYGVTTENGSGWEIDHIRPVAQGGNDNIENLQPLQWENNRHKSDDWPNWSCAKSAAR